MVEDVRQRTRLLLDPRARRRRLGQPAAAADVLPGDPLVAWPDGVTMTRQPFQKREGFPPSLAKHRGELRWMRQSAFGAKVGSRAALFTLFIGLMLSIVWTTPAADQQPPGGRGGRGAGRGAAPRTRKAVLAWADTRNGIAQHDSVSHALAVIERLGYESGLYDTYIRTDSSIISKHPTMSDGKPASGGPSLANVDAIFFLGHRDVELNPRQKADLLSLIKDEGKGFVASHTALTAFESWPEFGELLGGRYDGHPWNTAYGTVINEDPSFPATKHLAPTFAFTDEFYQPKELSRDKVHVLLRLDLGKMPPNAELHAANGDFALAWAK